MTGRYSPAQLEQFVDAALRDGHCLLREHFSRPTLQRWREAFQPLLDEHLDREGDLQNRGSGRYYVTLPFRAPFADSAIYEDPDVLAIVEALVGADPVLCQLASDTPMRGSDYQEVHRDAPPLFPEWGRETPPFQLAVNFPLCDVTSENGPFEVAAGTHMLTKEEGMARLDLEPVLMKLGDVMVRDVRGLHRGTPNRTDVPRPMCVIGYSRKWLLRPEVHIRVPRDVHQRLSERGKRLLRHNPIVEPGQELGPAETYQAYAY